MKSHNPRLLIIKGKDIYLFSFSCLLLFPAIIFSSPCLASDDAFWGVRESQVQVQNQPLQKSDFWNNTGKTSLDSFIETREKIRIEEEERKRIEAERRRIEKEMRLEQERIEKEIAAEKRKIEEEKRRAQEEMRLERERYERKLREEERLAKKRQERAEEERAMRQAEIAAEEDRRERLKYINAAVNIIKETGNQYVSNMKANAQYEAAIDKQWKEAQARAEAEAKSDYAERKRQYEEKVRQQTAKTLELEKEFKRKQLAAQKKKDDWNAQQRQYLQKRKQSCLASGGSWSEGRNACDFTRQMAAPGVNVIGRDFSLTNTLTSGSRLSAASGIHGSSSAGYKDKDWPGPQARTGNGKKTKKDKNDDFWGINTGNSSSPKNSDGPNNSPSYDSSDNNESSPNTGQNTSNAGAAVCIATQNNADNNYTDVEYFVRYGQKSAGKANSVARKAYKAKYSGTPTCRESPYEMDHGIVVIIEASRKGEKDSRHTFGVGYGKLYPEAISDAVANLKTRDWSWSEPKHGYSVRDSYRF